MDENFAIQLFEGKKVRIVWDAEQEKYYFSVTDIVQVLTDSVNPRDYIKKMLRRDPELKSKWGTICPPVEMLAPDGKKRKTQAADLEGIFRIIQSIPSKKAEPSQIPAFSEQIRLTRNAINENLLLIEDEHYKKLIKLIGQFEQFQFGKQKLIDIRAQGNDNMASQITKGEARETINQNRKTKENYDNLIMDIGKSFRTQIKG